MTKRRTFKEVMLRRMFNFLVSLFCGTAATAAPDAEPVNVLFIGNSYTHQNRMPRLFEKIAKSQGANVHVEMSAKSSHTFEMHCGREEMFETIKSKPWDYVILQGFSRELAKDKEDIDSLTVPHFDRILDSIYTNNACTNVLLYMTWGYKNGYRHESDINSYTKMTDKVYDGYQYLSEKYEIPIAPVGHVWREVRQSSNMNLYQKDEQHPTIYGSYISACTFYSAIFKSSPVGAHSGSMKDKYAEKIQKTAFNYVMGNLDEFRLNRNMFTVQQDESGNQYVVRCEANFPKADSVNWDLGDGTTAESSQVRHTYKRPGIYFIELRIRDLCGLEEVYSHEVEFNPSNKPEDNTPKQLIGEFVQPTSRKRSIV